MESNQVFTGNRTRVKVVGLEKRCTIEQAAKVSPNHVLSNVSSLDLSYNSLAGVLVVLNPCRHSKGMPCSAIMLPNVEEIDDLISHATDATYGCVDHIDLECPKFQRVTWNTSEKVIYLLLVAAYLEL